MTGFACPGIVQRQVGPNTLWLSAAMAPNRGARELRHCTVPRASTLTAPSTSSPRVNTTLSKRFTTGQT
jgi:hypothetical protein